MIALAIAGPTASGKTALAVALHERFPCEIVSVDSVMVYRGLDIGSAKPDKALLTRAPHHLIDVVDPSDPYSAARFCEAAQALMLEITKRRRIPLFVGGTMLYFQALQTGLHALPSANDSVRATLAEQNATLGSEALHAELQMLDPASAARIHPNDPQRIHRALEVQRLTGAPQSDLYSGQRRPVIDAQWLNFLLLPGDRKRLHTSIENRFHEMLAQGLVEEVARLKERTDLSTNLPALRAVGYRQAWEYLDQVFDHRTLVARGIAATRQYAKRQLTWLRNRPMRGESYRLEAQQAPDKLIDAVSKIIIEKDFLP